MRPLERQQKNNRAGCPCCFYWKTNSQPPTKGGARLKAKRDLEREIEELYTQ